MKKMTFSLMIALSLVFGALHFSGCQSAPAAAGAAKDTVQWAGVYSGVIPAADGPGIDVEITLDQDGTYKLSYEYLKNKSTYNSIGPFTWDKTGSIVVLHIKGIPPYYRVEEGQLTQLDMQGKEIKSKTGNYVLIKKDNGRL